MSFNCFSWLDAALIKQEMGEPKASRSPAVWPSEASAERLDKTLFPILGKCHRQAFLRMAGFSVTNPSSAENAWKWIIGREVESNLVNQAQLAGIYAASGVKHFVRDITLSLEFDVIAIDPLDKRGYILECKTYSGYYAAKEIETLNRPKLENIIQLCLYILEARNGKRLKEMIRRSLDERKVLDRKVRDLKKEGVEFEHRNRCHADLKALREMSDEPIGGKLLYVNRDSGERKEFLIEIHEDYDGFHYPKVDGIPFKVFTMESVYARYKTLQGYWFRARSEAAQRLAKKGILPPSSLKLILCPQDVVETESSVKKTAEENKAEAVYLKVLEEEVRLLPSSFWPPAEYEYSYSPERIEHLYKNGQLSKKKYEDYKKDKVKRLGDWQCSYCATAGHCLGAEKPQMSYLLADLLADMSADVEFGEAA